MAILFVNNSPLLFGNYLTTSTLERDSAYSPYGIITDAVFDNQSSSPMRPNVFIDAAVGDLWVHFRARSSGDVFDSDSDGDLFEAYDANGDLVARLDATNGDFRAEAIGDTNVFGASTFTWADNQNKTIDMRIAVGANVEVFVYENGTLVSSASAANTGAKLIPVDLIWRVVDLNDVSNPGEWYFSEFIVTDGEDTRGWRLATLEAASAGFYTDFVGDFNQLGDRQLVSGAASATDGDRVSSGLSAYGGAASTVRAVVNVANAQRGPAGISQLTQFLRIGGTDYSGATETFATGEKKQLIQVWNDNPATAVPWVTGDLATLEMGLLANT
jgi:hypothetical protein